MENNKFRVMSIEDDGCDKELPEYLRNLGKHYESRAFREWLDNYFRSSDGERKVLKQEASTNTDLNKVASSLPVVFTTMVESKEFYYWFQKYNR